MALVEVVAPPLADPAVVGAGRGDSSPPGARRRSSAPTARASSSTGSTGRSRSRRCGSSRPARPASSEIDEAMRDAGFPMGPFELMDLTGIDVNLAAATGSGRASGDRTGSARRRSRSGSSRPATSAARPARASTDTRTGGGSARPGDRRHPPRPSASRRRDPRADPRRHRRRGAAGRAEGVASPDAIDLALRLGAGHPRGPFELDPRILMAGRRRLA